MVYPWHPVFRSAGELRIEQIGETGCATAEVRHIVGNTTGLDSDRDDRCAGQGIDEHERIAARCTTDGTELVPTDENELARDAGEGPSSRPPSAPSWTCR